MLAHARLGRIVSVQQCCFVVQFCTLSFCFATMASTALSSAQPWKNARTGNAPSTASGDASDKAAGAASDKATGAASDQAARAATDPTPLVCVNGESTMPPRGVPCDYCGSGSSHVVQVVQRVQQVQGAPQLPTRSVL